MAGHPSSLRQSLPANLIIRCAGSQNQPVAAGRWSNPTLFPSNQPHLIALIFTLFILRSITIIILIGHL
jgi:hypothetical protein